MQDVETDTCTFTHPYPSLFPKVWRQQRSSRCVARWNCIPIRRVSPLHATSPLKSSNQFRQASNVSANPPRHMRIHVRFHSRASESVCYPEVHKTQRQTVGPETVRNNSCGEGLFAPVPLCHWLYHHQNCQCQYQSMPVSVLTVSVSVRAKVNISLSFRTNGNGVCQFPLEMDIDRCRCTKSQKDSVAST